MKARWIVVVFLMLAIVPARNSIGQGAWYDDYDFAGKGVVAYCPFETDTNDVTGNGNNPTNYGITIVSGGRFGNCAHVEIDDDAYAEYTTLEFGDSPATWAFWYRPQQVFDRGSTVLSRQEYGSPGNYIAFGEPDAGPHIQARVGPDPSVVLRSSVDHFVGQWYHVALVISPDEGAKFYVNGSLEITDSMGKAARVIGTPYLGNTPLYDHWGTQVDGDVDDLIVFNRALGGWEIELLASDGNTDGRADFLADAVPTSTWVGACALVLAVAAIATAALKLRKA